MEQQCAKLSPGLANVLFAVANVVGEISDILRSADADEQSGSHNKFGDSQLKLDMAVDALIFERLGSCSSVATASSEEKPESIPMPGSGYSVAFDPLDGSSIVGANFAVGTIFGIWKGSTIVGSSSREQVAAAYAVYGPRTVLVWACPRDQDSENSPAVAPSSSHVVQEFVLTGPAQKQGALKYRWRLQRDNVAITESKNVFAPANLRAAAENEAYQALVGTWMKRNFTLRYTGGMVPDVHHIIAKGGGVFCNPTSNSAPAKLRLLYECVPLALIIEAAGGSSHDGKGSLLDRVIDATSIRTKVCLGTAEMVESCIPALQAH